jgi:hypothetical protein
LFGNGWLVAVRAVPDLREIVGLRLNEIRRRRSAPVHFGLHRFGLG